MKHPIVTILTSVALILILFSPAVAQQEEPSWASFTTVTVKPEKESEFLDLLKTSWYPAIAKSDLPFIETWRSARFGDQFEYVFLSPIENFAEFDGPPAIQRAMSPEDYAVLFSRLLECVNSVNTVAQMFRPDLSFDKLEGKEPKLAFVSTVRVKSGKSGEYEKLIRDSVLPHLRKLDYPATWSQQTVIGGPQNQWTHIVVIENFAHIDKGPPLVRALGSEKAQQLEAQFGELVEAETLSIYSRVAELSHSKQQQQ